jgi:adenine-specific DNA-methyltransferase
MRDEVRVIHGDALKVMRGMPDGAFDAVVTDPPYFRVADEAWDKQWDSADAYLGWLGEIADEWRRLLKPSGSLYVFASSKMAARVECLIDDRFNVVNRIVWRKQAAWTRESKVEIKALRSYFPVTEWLVFAEKRDAGGIIKTAREEAGLSAREVAEIIGAYGKVNHGGAVTNWETGLNTPGPLDYEKLRSVLDLPPYKDAIRPFRLNGKGPHVDVWDFAGVPASRIHRHPCEKPVPLLRHILNTSTREGDTVLDCFAGSGSLAEACIKTGRRAVLVESADRYIPVIERRLAGAATPLFDAIGGPS